MIDSPIEVVHGRHNPLIDPTQSIWGWEIPVYLFLGGLAAGLLIVPSVIELRARERPRSAGLRLAPWLSLLVLSLGMAALFLDLAFKTHVHRFYLAFRATSPMSWGSWILLLVYPVGYMLGMGGLAEGERAALLRWAGRLRLAGPIMCAFGRAESLRRRLLWAGVAVGACLGVYTGILLGSMAARPGWSSAVMGPLFLASGLSTGAALLLLTSLDEGERLTVVRLDVAAILLEMALIGVMLVGFATGDRAGQHAFLHLVARSWAGPFWAVVVVSGLAVPLTLEAIEIKRRLPLAVLAPVLVLIGGLALRFVLMSSGQASGFREFP
jgi:formate-dependent nitrite reductase membrane component NrfD